MQVVSFSLLSTLSTSRINEVRFGYSRYRTSFSSLDANFDPTTIGLNFGTGKMGLPEFDFTNIENLGATGFSVPRGRTSGTYQILDNFTWLRGKHTFKFGGEFRRASINNFNDNLERGIFQFTAGVGLSTDPVVDALANFYTGGSQDSSFCCSYQAVDTGSTQRTTFNNGFSFFAQDDYRIASNFTLNAGIRWEYFGPMSEKNGLLSNLGQDGNLAMVGTDGLHGLYHRDLHDFGPRIGFAWNALKNTVVRGGYGMYYDYVPQDLLIANFTTSATSSAHPGRTTAVGRFSPMAYADNSGDSLMTCAGPTIPARREDAVALAILMRSVRSPSAQARGYAHRCGSQAMAAYRFRRTLSRSAEFSPDSAAPMD